ncbi:MAG: ribbon-helix-helix domain-containing protein [Bdellovibrionota bacterium]
MGRKKISTTVYLTAEQVRALKDLHERTRVPIAEYIRMGIDLILEKYSDKLPGQISLFDLNSMGGRPKSTEESENPE